MDPWSVPAAAMPVDATYTSYLPADGTRCIADNMPACELTDLLRVGSDPKGNGRWEQADLGGNVNERALDGFATPYMSPCVDCAVTGSATVRVVVRGGSYNDDAPSMLATARFSRDATKRDGGIGIRCARAP